MNFNALIDPFGKYYINPSVKLIGYKLEELLGPKTDLCPHRDLSLTDYESGLVLVYNHNKVLILENINSKEEQESSNQYISDIALGNAFDLFTAFNNREFKFILNLPWKYQT